MNIEIVKENFRNNLGKSVRVTVYGMRNKVNYYEGVLYKIYPNIFTIFCEGTEKNFAYRDVITKDINVKIL